MRFVLPTGEICELNAEFTASILNLSKQAAEEKLRELKKMFKDNASDNITLINVFTALTNATQTIEHNHATIADSYLSDNTSVLEKKRYQAEIIQLNSNIDDLNFLLYMLFKEKFDSAIIPSIELLNTYLGTTRVNHDTLVHDGDPLIKKSDYARYDVNLTTSELLTAKAVSFQY